MSNLSTIYDDIFDLIKNTINNSSESSDSSSSLDEINVVKQFTDQNIEQEQIAIGISNMNNLQHNGCNDYEISVTVSGQTYYETDPNKQQILALFGIVQSAIQSLSVDDIEIYVENIAGYLVEDSTFDNDDLTNTFAINLKFYVTDLI